MLKSSVLWKMLSGAKLLTILLVCAAHSAPIPPDVKKDPAAWFKAAYFDIDSLGELIKTYPNSSEWTAKAQLQIAGFHGHLGTHLSNIPLQAQTAANEYQSVIDRYPDQLTEVAQAKAGMATLYWNKLDKKKKALELWKELEAQGKLPPDSPYARGARTAPVVLIRDLEKNYGFGVSDFDVIEDGSLNVVKNVREKVLTEGGPRDVSVTHLLRFSAAGIFSSTITTNGIRAGITPTLYMVGDRAFMKAEQKLLVLGSRGELTGELVNQYERFQFFPGGPNQSAGLGSTEQIPLGFIVGESGFQAFYPDSLRKFNFSGDLLSKVNVDYCKRREPNKVEMAENSKGEVVAAEPACGIVLRIGLEGVRLRIAHTQGPEGTFSSISDMYLASNGDSYILDVQGKSILRYNKSGKFSAQFVNDAVDEYSKVAADAGGNIYLFGRPVAFGGAIIVLNAKGEETRRFNVKYDAIGGMHKCIVDDLETSKGRIYAAIDRYIVEFDEDGKILSKITRPPMNWGRSGMRLAKDRKGRIAFMDRGQVYLIENGNERLLVDFHQTSHGGEPSEFGFDETGSLIVKGNALYRYELSAKTLEEIKGPKGIYFQSAVVNPHAGILASGMDLMGSRAMNAYRLSNHGGILACMSSAISGILLA